MLKNILRIGLILLCFVVLLALAIHFKKGKSQDHIAVTVPEDVTIVNESENWEQTSFAGKSDSCKLPLIKINSVSFGTDKDRLYAKFYLAGTMPVERDLPSCSGDKVIAAVYYIDIDENYFDAAGNKNPGGPDAQLKMSFYGHDKDIKPADKISVDGELVAGGPGYDYFVASYPFNEILMYGDNPSLVVSAWSLALSENWTAGVSGYRLKNSSMAAEATDPTKIKIDLKLKK